MRAEDRQAETLNYNGWQIINNFYTFLKIFFLAVVILTNEANVKKNKQTQWDDENWIIKINKI